MVAATVNQGRGTAVDVHDDQPRQKGIRRDAAKHTKGITDSEEAKRERRTPGM
jgi:hypothetical protein